MKLNVLTDDQGNILGMAGVGSFRLEDGTTFAAGLTPQAGQNLHEVEIKEEFSSEQMQDAGFYQKLDELVRSHFAGFSQH